MKDLNYLNKIRMLVFIVIMNLIGSEAYGQTDLLCGDLNKDNNHTVSDIVVLVNYTLGTVDEEMEKLK